MALGEYTVNYPLFLHNDYINFNLVCKAKLKDIFIKIMDNQAISCHLSAPVYCFGI